jgi:hypothetical protein
MSEEQAFKTSAEAAVSDKSHFDGYRAFMVPSDLK